jgi:hypothetical protein
MSAHSLTLTLCVTCTFQCSYKESCSAVAEPLSFAANRSIIGLSDGLTVPFALTAGLSSIGSSRIVVLGGVAELIAGAISMGIGGFCKSLLHALRTAQPVSFSLV